MSRSFLTPPAVAEMLGVNADKVLTWIRSGELAAIDIAQHQGGRPRYRVGDEDLQAFLLKRRTTKPAGIEPRRRKAATAGKDYF